MDGPRELGCSWTLSALLLQIVHSALQWQEAEASIYCLYIIAPLEEMMPSIWSLFHWLAVLLEVSINRKQFNWLSLSP